MARNDEFGRLLNGAINSIAAYENKRCPAVQRELGELLFLSGAAIDRYRRGHIPPDLHSVEVLASECVRRGMLARRWASRFLHAAKYDNPTTLIDSLYK